jgi:uncharacterized protein (DUF58 family)
VKGALLALMLALCAIPPLYLNAALAWLPLLSLGFALLCSGLYLLVLRRTLHCTGAAGRSSCQRGEQIPLTVAIGNRGILACPRLDGTLQLADGGGNVILSESVAAVLPAFSRKSLSLNINMTHVGSYQAKLTQLRAYALFGLFSVRLPDPPPAEILCLPRIWKLPSPAYSQLPMDENSLRHSSPDEGYDYTGVRDYAPGDPIKNIHWKLSAHQPAGALSPYLTRLLDRPGAPGVSILLDLRMTGQRTEEILGQLDALTECAWSLMEGAAADGFEAEICFFDRENIFRRLSVNLGDDRERLASLLPPVLSRPEGSLEPLLHHVLANQGKKNLVLCTGNADREAVYLLSETRNRRRIPFLYWAIPRSEQKKLDACPVSCVVFNNAAQLVNGGAS